MSLPYFQTNLKELNLLQTKWKAEIDPVLAQPLLGGNVLQAISLTAGANVINHKLGRKLQGWTITRQRADANIYDTQDANQTPALTLQLTSNNPVVVDILVF
jgi:hypothetical protein